MSARSDTPPAGAAAAAEPATAPTPTAPAQPAAKPGKIPEIGGPAGPEPTRYGDWERKGRCIDF